MPDTETFIEGKNTGDYLIRSVAIVSLLYERGILTELIESDRISEEEVNERTEIIKQKFPGFDGIETDKA